MSLEITNGEVFEFILSNGNLQDRSVKIAKKFRNLASLFIKKHHLGGSLSAIQVTLKAIYDVKNKDDDWRNTVKTFERESLEPKSKLGRPLSTRLDSPCERVEKQILKYNLSVVATTAAEHGETKEDMLKKMVPNPFASKYGVIFPIHDHDAVFARVLFVVILERTKIVYPDSCFNFLILFENVRFVSNTIMVKKHLVRIIFSLVVEKCRDFFSFG